MQKCLKSSNKAIYQAAIDSLKNASMMFGPALNKHLKHIVPLVLSKADLVKRDRIDDLFKVLVVNGGDEAKHILNELE